MYFAECARLADVHPEWQLAIERIDSLLQHNAAAAIDLELLLDFAGQPPRTVEAILSHLQREGLIRRTTAVYCPRHGAILSEPDDSSEVACDLCSPSEDLQRTTTEVIRVCARKKRKVFFSYAAADRVLVGKIIDELESRNLDVWYDQRSIRPGSSIPGAINQGLENADYFLIALSRASVTSEWANAELDAALMKHKSGKLFILPILLEKCQIPPLLSALSIVDFSADFEGGVQKLSDFFSTEAQIADGEVFGLRAVAATQPTSPVAQRRSCQEVLATLEMRELRKRLTVAITLSQLKLIWGDLFQDRLDDHFPNIPLANGCQELIHRAGREHCQQRLYSLLCEEVPHIAYPLQADK